MGTEVGGQEAVMEVQAPENCERKAKKKKNSNKTCCKNHALLKQQTVRVTSVWTFCLKPYVEHLVTALLVFLNQRSSQLEEGRT